MIIDATLDFHTLGKLTGEQISFYLNKFLQESFQQGYQKLLVITGKGVDSSGLVRKIVLRDLLQHKLVQKSQIASAEAGGDGAFEVWLVC